MATFIKIELERKLSEQLERAMREVSDLSEPMHEISELMLEKTHERFGTETGLNGVPWKKSERAKKKAGGKTLYDQGTLHKSLRRMSGKDFAEVGVESGGPQATYAVIHQFGGTITPKRKKALSFGGRILSKVIMPERPYLGFDQEDRGKIENVLERHIRSVFGEAK